MTRLLRRAAFLSGLCALSALPAAGQNWIEQAILQGIADGLQKGLSNSGNSDDSAALKRAQERIEELEGQSARAAQHVRELKSRNEEIEAQTRKLQSELEAEEADWREQTRKRKLKQDKEYLLENLKPVTDSRSSSAFKGLSDDDRAEPSRKTKRLESGASPFKDASDDTAPRKAPQQSPAPAGSAARP